MNFETLHPADQLVMLMERIYSYGMTTTSGGNLSILDDNGDIWITPAGYDKGSLTRKDIVQVKPDGTVTIKANDKKAGWKIWQSPNDARSFGTLKDKSER